MPPRFPRIFLAVVVAGVMVAVLQARRASEGVQPGSAGEGDSPRSRLRPNPDRIILTWKTDPVTSQAVTWRTDASAKGGLAQLAEAADGPSFDPAWGKGKYDPRKVVTISADSQELGPALYHSVNFTNLRPKTKYVYRVSGGMAGVSDPGHNWSEWFQFETASDRPEPFGFVYFGDAQNGIKSHWSRVVRGAYSDMPKAKFIVHAGDLVNSGGNDDEWGEWHAAAGWINGMVPSVPSPGNHEYGKGGITSHWHPQFTLPENGPPGLAETCYFLDYQGVRVVSLNSNEKVAEQTTWLDSVLANRPKSIRWTVLTFHHPIYSTAKGRDNKSLREAWRPIIDKHGVDLVLQGHDHAYGRSGLMREDNLLTGSQVRSQRGTVYVVSVSGAKMYGLGREPWMESAGQDTQLYQLIRIDDDTLHYESRTARGDLYDSFVLRQHTGRGNELVNGATSPAAAGGREGNVVAAAVIGVAVLLGVGWAVRR